MILEKNMSEAEKKLDQIINEIEQLPEQSLIELKKQYTIKSDL